MKRLDLKTIGQHCDHVLYTALKTQGPEAFWEDVYTLVEDPIEDQIDLIEDHCFAALTRGEGYTKKTVEWWPR